MKLRRAERSEGLGRLGVSLGINILKDNSHSTSDLYKRTCMTELVSHLFMDSRVHGSHLGVAALGYESELELLSKCYIDFNLHMPINNHKLYC
jgi:hypothetical protein